MAHPPRAFVVLVAVIVIAVWPRPVTLHTAARVADGNILIYETAGQPSNRLTIHSMRATNGDELWQRDFSSDVAVHLVQGVVLVQQFGV